MAAQITALPSVPSRQDPTNFNDRADAFLGALPTFQSEANALSTEVNTRADDVQASHAAVLAATNITKWVSGTTYAQGAVVWSPGNGLGYRRITAAGSGTTDPALDTTNYKQVNGTGDVSTTGDQSIAGVKTFVTRLNLSEPLFVSNGGTGADNAVSAFGILKQAATESYAGVIELATSQEALNGTDTVRGITPATLRSGLSASGSAPIYAARAWVNFSGTGTVYPLGGGNVSSITDNGTGDYTVNFFTAMPHALYAVAGVGARETTSAAGIITPISQTTSAYRFTVRDVGNVVRDGVLNSIVVFT